MERNGFRPKVWRYGWNALDRLVSCETPEGERWAYGYDPFGRRLWKRREESSAAGGSGSGVGVIRSEARVGEAFLWDGDVVADAAPLYADGTIAWDKAVSWHHEPGTFRPIAQEDTQTVHHVVTDHLGTPREMYDAQGRCAWSRSYRLWGETRGWWRGPAPANDETVSLAAARAERSSAITTDRDAEDMCPIGFPGQWTDPESGLAYNRFRYYDANASFYLSIDPFGLYGGLRPSAYVDCPLTIVDCLGLSSSVPQKAQDVINYANKNGGASQLGYRGDTPFANDGRGGGQVLPEIDSAGNPISCREYDVNPFTQGVNRGAERVVSGGGNSYYTNDHYKTFTPIK